MAKTDIDRAMFAVVVVVVVVVVVAAVVINPSFPIGNDRGSPWFTHIPPPRVQATFAPPKLPICGWPRSETQRMGMDYPP